MDNWRGYLSCLRFQGFINITSSTDKNSYPRYGRGLGNGNHSHANNNNNDNNQNSMVAWTLLT